MKNPYDMTMSECADAVSRYAYVVEDLARVANHMGLPPETTPFVVICALTDCIFGLKATQPDVLVDCVARAKSLSETLEKNR